MSITITELAAAKIKNFIKEEKLPEDTAGLRVGVEGGGCAGFTQTLTLDKEKTDSDQVFEQFGVRIFCDETSYMYLKGTEIDYQENSLSSGFSFKNPNSKGGCGCGKSQSF